MTTTDSINAERILAAIDAQTSTTQWTTRGVLRELQITDNNRNRKSCRQALHGLWEAGKIAKPPVKSGSDLVIYRKNASVAAD